MVHGRRRSHSLSTVSPRRATHFRTLVKASYLIRDVGEPGRQRSNSNARHSRWCLSFNCGSSSSPRGELPNFFGPTLAPCYLPSPMRCATGETPAYSVTALRERGFLQGSALSPFRADPVRRDGTPRPPYREFFHLKRRADLNADQIKGLRRYGRHGTFINGNSI